MVKEAGLEHSHGKNVKDIDSTNSFSLVFLLPPGSESISMQHSHVILYVYMGLCNHLLSKLAVK